MFKKLTDDANLPQRSTKYSAGFDVYANEDVVIGAGETKLVGLGIAIDQNLLNITKMLNNAKVDPMTSVSDYMKAHYLELHIRSSLRVKGLTSLGTGIIDIDYPDEIKMVVHRPIEFHYCNSLIRGETIWKKEILFESSYPIRKGDKIGQLILKRHEGYLMPQEYTLDAERSGGFGSTGQ